MRTVGKQGREKKGLKKSRREKVSRQKMGSKRRIECGKKKNLVPRDRLNRRERERAEVDSTPKCEREGDGLNDVKKRRNFSSIHSS